ncbi:MAG: hypothetical protein JWN13_2486 [Betaproteobacteria bacterium]|jgi:hypothetical protein|nr:hypothetical protein [Betaproteobacteria bacterium]
MTMDSRADPFTKYNGIPLKIYHPRTERLITAGCTERLNLSSHSDSRLRRCVLRRHYS